MLLKFLSSPQLAMLKMSAAVLSVAAARPTVQPPLLPSKFQGESRFWFLPLAVSGAKFQV